MPAMPNQGTTHSDHSHSQMSASVEEFVNDLQLSDSILEEADLITNQSYAADTSAHFSSSKNITPTHTSTHTLASFQDASSTQLHIHSNLWNPPFNNDKLPSTLIYPSHNVLLQLSLPMASPVASPEPTTSASSQTFSHKESITPAISTKEKLYAVRASQLLLFTTWYVHLYLPYYLYCCPLWYW